MQSQIDIFDECEQVYTLTPHVCRYCGGRVLQQVSGSSRAVRCAECGVVGGDEPDTICCCGVCRADGEKFLRCIENPDRKPGAMNEIVVEQLASESS